MTIIVSKGGKDATKVQKSAIAKEGYLQQYIFDNPDAIPLYEYKEEIRLLILAREFSTNSGAIDAVGIDEEGEIYLVETKLYKNPDKRLVVAQVLDYGAALWRNYQADDFLKALDDCVRKALKQSMAERIQAFFALDAEGYAVLEENLTVNVRDGNFRFVVLMDRLHERLKDLILYINKNSRFDVFAVEMSYYKHDGYEIVIPKLFGAEGKKDVGLRGEKWDSQRFLAAAERNLGKGAEFKRVKQLHDFTLEQARLDWGRGGESGTFTFKFEHPDSKSGWVSLFTVKTDGNIRFRFGNVSRRLGKAVAARYFDVISGLPIAKGWDKERTVQSYGPAVKVSEAFANEKALAAFENGVLKFLREAQDTPTKQKA